MIKDDRALEPMSRGQRWSWRAARALVVLLFFTGCVQQRYITRRERPNPFLAGPLNVLTRQEPRPTARTLQLLRRYDLLELQEKRPEVALTKLQQEVETDPNPDKICSYAELAYLDGQRLQARGKPKDALDVYATSVAPAYWFLLDQSLYRFRISFELEFLWLCDLSNAWS